MRNPIAPDAIEWFTSPVGPLIAAATSEAVCRLEFSDENSLAARLQDLRAPSAGAPAAAANRHLEELQQQLAQYFRGERREFTVPLAYPGTAFQERVWSALCRIRRNDPMVAGRAASGSAREPFPAGPC